MDKDRAIEYINQLLISEYDLMQDRKLDTSNPSLYDKEATETELDEIVNAQEFMRDYITSHVPIPEEAI
jgi:hypothetical protein|tara:strand:- start:314 stop:520 length:207 start_codon:yes stop_codon:yes gene_type:complete